MSSSDFLTDVEVDFYAPDEPDEDNLGLVVIDGWAYTPEETREFASRLIDAARHAEWVAENVTPESEENNA